MLSHIVIPMLLWAVVMELCAIGSQMKRGT